MAVIAKQRYKLDIAPSGGWVIVYASQHDNGAREIEFEITNQGNAYSIPASINVSVQGVKSNKGYFSHSCSYTGNIVKMALANDMTDVIGKAICVLKFTNSSQQKLATAKFVLNVDTDSSSEGIIVDTEAEEIFNQMLNEIRAQAASISADIAELQSMVGSPLVASTASAMTNHNKIYVYTGSESGYTNGNWYYWNGSAWTSGGVYNSVAFETDKTLAVANMAADAKVVGDEIKNIGYSNAISLDVNTDGTKKGVTFTHIGNNIVTIVGQGDDSGAILQNLIQTEELPIAFCESGKICIYFENISRTANTSIPFDVYIKTTENSSWSSFIVNKSGLVVETLPAGCTGVLVRTHLSSDATYNETTKVYVTNGLFPNFSLPEDHFLASQYRNSNASYLEESDFNNVTSTGFYCWSGQAYAHNPYTLITDVGFLFVMRWHNIIWQMVTGYGPRRSKIYVRERNASNWMAWKAFGGSTESNLFLEPTGDSTDMSATIEFMLSNTGVCRLGTGDFYVSGIDMPDGTALIGSGPDTRVILLGANTDEGYAIKIGSNCLVQNMMILGNTTDIEYSGVSSNVVERHGVLFSGHFSTDQTDYKTRSLVNSCWIKNFTGGGITCKDTGYGTAACIGVTDCYIWYCNAGIYVPFFSEFHRFTSVHCHNCYYGAVNNGGNCVFVNCGFSANKIGMLMDNTSGTLRNDSHGTVIGCVFDHADGNNGVGIKIIGMSNGEIFSDCQLFYSDIEIKNSKGLQFNNFNVGGTGVNIKVEKGTLGGLILFYNWLFKTDSYSFQIDDGYTECKFNNCWTWDGIAVNP